MDRAAAVKLTETPRFWEASGPYNEMVGINPKLKRMGFRWDPSDKVWRIPKDKLTDRQVANLKKLVEGNGGGPKQSANPQEVQELLERASKLKLFGYSFQMLPKALTLSGDTYPIRDEVRKAGGIWSSGAKVYYFQFEDVKLKEFEELLKVIEDRSKETLVKIEMITDLVEKNNKWPTIGVSIRVENRRILVVYGNTAPVKDYIKQNIQDIRWESTCWKVSITRTTRKEVGDLIIDLDDLEKKAEAKALKEKTPVTPNPRQKMKNRRGDDCEVCGGWVEPGEGYLYQKYDPYHPKARGDEDMVWVVQHIDGKICEENKKAEKAKKEKYLSLNQMKSQLRAKAAKPSNYVKSPQQISLEGQLIMLDDRGLAYGGGSWVVIEPNKNYFWYVENNGADGDDWAGNNVSTGGAGAIGYRLSLDDEARELIEQVSGETIS